MSDNSQYPSFRWTVLVLAVLAEISMQLVNLCVAPLIPTIANNLGTTPGVSAEILITTFLFAGCIVWVLGGGYVCDKYGPLVSLIIGMLCLAIPAALMPYLGGSVMSVAIVRCIQGVSTGFIFPTVPVIVNTLFPNNQKATANALLNSAVAAGSAIGVYAGPIVYGMVGGSDLNTGAWKTMSAVSSTFLWAVTIFAVMLYIAMNAKMPKLGLPPTEASGDSAFKKALFAPFTILGVISFFLAAWIMHCLFEMAPAYLAGKSPVGLGYSAVTAGSLMLGMTLLGGVVGPFVGSFMIDKVFKGNAKPVMLMGAFMLAVTIYLLMVPAVTGSGAAPSIGTLEIDLIVAGFGLMFVFPTIFYMIATSYPPQIIGRMCGLWGGIGSFGGVIGTYVAAASIDKYNTTKVTLTIETFVAVLIFVLIVLLFKARKSVLKLQKEQKELVGAAC